MTTYAADNICAFLLHNIISCLLKTDPAAPTERLGSAVNDLMLQRVGWREHVTVTFM